MSYKSKAEREAASYMTWSKIHAHVQEAEQCDKEEARRQIGNAIEDRVLSVRWADQREAVGALAPIQSPGDEPPRNSEFWQKCETAANDPDLVLEPAPYDRELVNKPTAARLDRKRRYRKPVFRRKQVFALWPLIPPSRPADAANAEAGSDTDSRRRGRKPETLNRIKEAMRGELRFEALTKQQLHDLTEEAMASRYGKSRDTCRRARREVLSESQFVDNSPDGNSDK
jgi:hypothetical protein